jgi:HD-GYP domain-containing protein (c-di-GMP phosphodiesterase class II)
MRHIDGLGSATRRAPVALVLGGGGLAQGALLVGPFARLSWHAPVALFVVVTVAASLCAAASVPIVVRAYRTGSAELGVLGAAMFNLSVLPLVHGLTAPGVLYGPNAAVVTSALVAGPAAVATCATLLASRSSFGRLAARHWRTWASGCMAAAVAFAATLLARPDVLPAPQPRSLDPLAVMVGCLSAMVFLSWRQLRLYWISQHSAFLVASLAVAFIALTSMVWMGRQPFTLGWWSVHVLDVAGVFGVLGGLWFAPRIRRGVLEVLDPVLSRDPLAAFEIGLAPDVHQFVASLDRKDAQTRDHVVRVGELAGRTAEALRLPADRLRSAILGGLLHDIGKLGVDDAVLTKPGRLTPAEYQAIQRHTVIGDELLRGVPSLVSVAPIVRAHHERLDGTGYPDGLHGEDIPLEARIIAVCDAYDAMMHTRHYRAGMGRDRALATLHDHAGTQWDPSILEVVARLGVDSQTGIFDQVGNIGEHPGGCACPDALPDTAHAAFAPTHTHSGTRPGIAFSTNDIA